LLEKANDYDPTRPFAPWALAFARFQVMAWRKRQSRDRLVLDDALVDALADRITADSAAPGRRLDALEKCLNKLPAESRQLVDARYSRGDPVQEIAAKLGRSVNVVSVTLFRIRKALLDCMRSALAAEGGVR
jgi:RNA polymerase sigma-70 factor (ECF subfamily)